MSRLLHGIARDEDPDGEVRDGRGPHVRLRDVDPTEGRLPGDAQRCLSQNTASDP